MHNHVKTTSKETLCNTSTDSCRTTTGDKDDRRWGPEKLVIEFTVVKLAGQLINKLWIRSGMR